MATASGYRRSKLVADGELLKREEIARIQFHRALQIAHSVFVRTSAARDKTSQFEDPRSIGHCAAGDLELGQRAIIIAIGRVKMIGAGEMCFAGIRLQLRQRLQGLFG